MDTLDPSCLLDLATQRMPFGRYQGRLLMDLPEGYLLWFEAKGFPQGELGQLLALMLEIDRNGLNYLLDPLKNVAGSA
jgi:uncharacterized protein (DUF3820 family)